MPFSPILYLHIACGTLGLLFGSVAIAVRKGSRLHATSGTIFSAAMIALGLTGAYIAFTKSQTGNILGGTLTVYMVATAWATARRRARTIVWLDWLSPALALAVGTACIAYGLAVARGQISLNDGVPAGMDFFLGSVILIAAAGDIHVLVRHGLSGRPRIARHLWRMCFGLFIASGSFFMGRQAIFPEFIRRSNVLIFLTVLPLILLVFWLIRIRFHSAFQRMTVRATDEARPARI